MVILLTCFMLASLLLFYPFFLVSVPVIVLPLFLDSCLSFVSVFLCLLMLACHMMPFVVLDISLL